MTTIEAASEHSGSGPSALEGIKGPPVIIPRSSPLPAAIVRWQRSHSEQLATVICKGTFDLAPGRLRLAKVQDVLLRGACGSSSSDIVPLKPRVDVVVRGSVYAPDRVPAESIVATLAIATVRKSVAVYCDRAWRDDGVLVYGHPFLRARLGYERAAGGDSSWNPVGIRFDEVDRNGRQRVPNIQPPGVALTSSESRFLPTGLGAIPEIWELRRARLSSPDAADEWWSRPLAGFDFSYFNAAPSDQQLVCVRNDEPLTLENLHPDHAILDAELPGLQVRARIAGVAGDEVALSIDTIAIDTDRFTVAITWRAVVVAPPGADLAGATFEIEKAEAGSASRPPQRTEPGALDGTDEITAVTRVMRDGPGAPPIAPALPFRASAPPEPNRAPHKTMMLEVEAIAATWNAGPRTVYPPPSADPAPHTPSPSSLPPPMPAHAASQSVLSARNVTLLPGQTIGQQSVMQGVRPPSSRPPPLSFAPQSLSLVELDARIASDAAADPHPSPTTQRQVEHAREDGRAEPMSDALQVLWFDPGNVKRLRVEYKHVVERLKPAPFDSSVATLFDSPKELQAQLEVAAILREADRAVHADLMPLVRRSADTGFFVAPVAVTEGVIKVSYDELQLLQVALQIAQPFSILEKRLKPVYDRAQSAVATPDVISEAGLRSLIRELFQTFQSCVRSVESGYLESETERVLLDRRAYKRRSFLDAEWLRAELTMGTGSPPVPLYLPAHLAQKLPLLASFHARVIIEVLPRQDHREQSPLATRVVALSRLLRFEGLSS